MSGIEFRDRPLKDGEKYHHRCTKCGAELHPDLAYSHKCARMSGFQDSDNPFIVKVGDLINKNRPVKEIVHAAKIALEQKQINEAKEET